MMVDKQADLVVNLEADKVTKEKRKVDQEQDEGSETVAMMMMVILIVDGELMDVIEMMVDKQADLVVNLEADKVTKEKRKVDQEQDEGSETVAMMMMVILIVEGASFYSRFLRV